MTKDNLISVNDGTSSINQRPFRFINSISDSSILEAIQNYLKHMKDSISGLKQEVSDLRGEVSYLMGKISQIGVDVNLLALRVEKVEITLNGFSSDKIASIHSSNKENFWGSNQKPKFH